MKRIILSLILAILGTGLFACSQCYANQPYGGDVIYLKNGIVLEGTILEQTDTFIRMNVDSRGEITLQMADIEKVVTQFADGNYNYAITSEYPNLPKTENPVVETKPETGSNIAKTNTPKKTHKPQKSFLPDDVYYDLAMGCIVSNFYLEARLGFGSGNVDCDNMPYGITYSYNCPGTMGSSYGTASLAGGMIMFFGNHCGFDFNIGYTQELGVAAFQGEYAYLSSPAVGMSMFDMYFGFLLGHCFRLGATCAIGSAYSSGDGWDEHNSPNYKPPMIYDDDLNPSSDFAFNWGVDLSYFLTPRLGITVYGRSCDISNRYTYSQPYPLNDIYVDNNSKRLSFGAELNIRIQPKCYNVKETISYESYGSYAIERYRAWKDCEEDD